MNILGIGPAELIVILVVMFMFAGPKRMVVWAYHLGRYLQQLRTMVDETWSTVRKEIEQSADVKLPENISDVANRRVNLLGEAGKLLDKETGGVTNSLRQDMRDVDSSLRKATSDIRQAATTPTNQPSTTPAATSATGNGASAPTPPDETKRYDAWTPN
jgi:Sec-independent protein translocase protein TatA